jgi:hypothetical protein
MGLSCGYLVYGQISQSRKPIRNSVYITIWQNGVCPPSWIFHCCQIVRRGHISFTCTAHERSRDDEPSDCRQPFRNATGNSWRSTYVAGQHDQNTCPPPAQYYVGHLYRYSPIVLLSSKYRQIRWARGIVVVKALYYKPEGRGFVTRWSKRMSSIYLILPAALGL